MEDIIFTPINFPNLTVKNRIFRSNIAGRFDNYNGSGTQARINFEEKFARGGVGAVISSHVPITIRGRILPNYATIECDERIPFWRKVGEAVHRHDCRYILQLSHGGRQRDMPGVENDPNKAQSSTNDYEPLHGFPCQAMTQAEIKQVIQAYADGARRAREAGLDGVELHACNGYLFTQFLSSGINDRTDEYGGSLENRARFLLEVIAAIRKEVGTDFHLQVKTNGIDYNDAVLFWKKKGNTIEDSIQVCKWVEEAGVDCLHISGGASFPHPLNPPGPFPVEVASKTYDTMLSSGRNTFRLFILLKFKALRPIFRFFWGRTQGAHPIEGVNVDAAREIKRAVKIPVLCTGGFQTASFIRRVISEGYVDGVAIARPLLANPDLVKIFAAGKDLPDKPCTYCNKCLLHVIEDPFGCYELSRYDGDYERMMRELMSVYVPDGFEE